MALVMLLKIKRRSAKGKLYLRWVELHPKPVAIVKYWDKRFRTATHSSCKYGICIYAGAGVVQSSGVRLVTLLMALAAQ
jgi:hypothetical protein